MSTAHLISNPIAGLPLRASDPQPALLERPIFIVGCHKSGTSLVRSLLDSHPQLCVAPLEPQYFRYAGFPVQYPLQVQHPVQRSWDDLVDEAVNFVRYKNASTDQYADSVLPETIDVALFESRLRSCLPTCHAAGLSLYFDGLHAGLRGSGLPRGTRVVHKSVDSAEFAPFFHAMFSDASFVHVVRNPYATLLSIRSAKEKMSERFIYLRPIVASIEYSYQHALRNSVLMPRYYLMRYEDLVSNVETEMTRLGEFLDIDFHPSLLSPTLNGSNWSGNSTSDSRFNGVSAKPAENWKGRLTAIEAAIAKQRLGKLATAFGYRDTPDVRGALRRIRCETIRTYAANRLLLYESS